MDVATEKGLYVIISHFNVYDLKEFNERDLLSYPV